jgi:hypothetical protein
MPLCFIQGLTLAPPLASCATSFSHEIGTRMDTPEMIAPNTSAGRQIDIEAIKRGWGWSWPT